MRKATMSPNRTRGQNAGLTRQAILQAALTLADRDGLKALSMRRIGQELGVEAMSLYQHVASKDALLDGLVEQIFTQAAPPLTEAASWQEGLREYARALLRVLLAHPNVIPLVVSRPAITPHNHRLMENALHTLQAAGLPPERALDMLYAVTGFVVGHVAILAAGRDGHTPARGMRAIPDQDLQQTPLLAQATRLRRSSGPDPRFDFALEAMLRGFDTL
ncbi:TetR/AcrR family transcriptional regulator C-terminal domain-containing protein [Streptosporangium sp. NBC_01639]|uniref:TetR/AcrR family transcriptional regulator C-terminal domain-containing protein n=1 Tax=Streptosporangium sp. NBC_01639 TaxID=2975948 RepID=UPI00386D578E|nr:TetR/AcrR family transcriptional regulator C-terminal domain-containing protein [Streptosporangium sp. NBC_01639]